MGQLLMGSGHETSKLVSTAFGESRLFICRSVHGTDPTHIATNRQRTGRSRDARETARAEGEAEAEAGGARVRVQYREPAFHLTPCSMLNF